MKQTTIQVEGLGKMYKLGEIGTGTISHDLNRWWASLRGREDPYAKVGEHNDRTTASGTRDYVWALKDVSFEAARGEVLGIIGRNGAGKSTLLKLLSKVTAPSKGRIKVAGRIASLLEVGTGFHPELTGRENIFLNGAILGMTKAEIKSKFDEIVDFAGVARYADTPVKRYSSGMYVRLAFAVAAFLEPEILIIDEVLAVGDQEFQKKCLGRMKDISVNDGRTVLFVSHNMAAINQLCDRTILMKNGMLESIGDTRRIVGEYLNQGGAKEEFLDLQDYTVGRSGNRKAAFKQVFLTKGSGPQDYCRVFSIGDDVHVWFSIRFSNPNESAIQASLELKNSEGMRIAHMIDSDSRFVVKSQAGHTVQYRVTLRDVRLYPDTYYLSLNAEDLSCTESYDYIQDCVSFDIIDGGKLTARALPVSAGFVFLTPDWEIMSGTD